MTRFPDPALGACFAGSRSPWSLSLAPPAPPWIAPLCSLASQLLRQSQTPRVRASSATTPRLPDADLWCPATGQTRGLPAPAQGASAHARVSDHAEPGGHSRFRARPCRLPCFEPRGHSGLSFFRGSMAGLCAPLPTLRPPSHERIRTARGRGGSLRRLLVVDSHHLLLAGLPAHSA